MSDARPIYEVLTEAKAYRAGWYNPERAILLIQVFGPWDLQDALDDIPFLNQQSEAIGHPIYTIFEYLNKDSPLLPKGTNILNIRQLVEYDPPNEQLVIFIREDSLTRNLLNILAKVYSMKQLINKYRFVHTWDEAMTQINEHRALILA